MQKILILTLLLIFTFTKAQTQIEDRTPRKDGFLFGVAVGAGTLTLNTNDTSQTAFSVTLPNLKFGYMLKDNFALLTIFPGATYTYNGKDRGFEGVIVAGQYWVKDKWWVLGGTGFTFDAPAFYTVKDPKSANFFTGLPAFAFATGLELYQKKKFTIDLHYRLFLGQSNLDNGAKRKGISNMLIFGFNWY